AAAQRHLAGAIALDKDGAHAERATTFVPDNHAAQGGGHHAGRLELAEFFRERLAELLGKSGMLQYQRTLYIGCAMQPTRKLEVSLADRAYIFQQLENFFAIHSCLPQRAQNG